MKQKKTVLNTQETPIIQKPTGVDTTGVQKTPELMANQKVSTFTPAPVAGLDGQFKTTADITAPKVNVNPQDAFNKARERGLAQMARNPQPGETPPPTGPFDTGNGEMSDGTTKVFDTGNGEMSDGTTKTPTAETPVTTPEGTTTTVTETPKKQPENITYQEDKQPYTPEKVISKAETFVGQDGKQYQTVRNADNTLTTIDTQTGQPVTGKYTDTEREQIKQSFVGTTVQPTTDDYYAKIQSGGTVPQKEKGTTAYKQAENRKVNLDKFSNMSSSDLSYAISQGQFLPGTQVYNDLKAQNPQLVADAERLNAINSKNSTQRITPELTTQSISDYLTKLMTQEEKVSYAGRISENKDISELNKSLGETATKMAEIKDQLEYSVEDLRKDFGGKTVTKGYLNSKNSERTRELGRQYNLLLAEYNTTAGQIQTISEGIKYEIEEERIQQQTNLQNFQAGLNMLNQMPGDINSTNPILQQRGIETAVNQLYSQYPIPGMESPTAKIEKVNQMIAQGMTPQQAIQQLEQEIRATDRYKNYINPPVAQTESWQKLSDNSLYNQATGEIKNVGGTGMTANVSVQTDPQSIVDFCVSKRGRDSVQCGELVNDYIFKITGTDPQGDLRFENTLADKNKAIETIGESTVPVVGGLFTLDVGTTAGHTGIVQSVDGNQITVLEANREGKKEGQPPVIATYTINDKMRFSQAPKSQPQYTDSDIELLSELANMDASARNTALKAQGIPLSAVTDYMALAKAGKIPPTESQKQSAMGIMSNIQGISELDWNDAIGRFDPTRVIGTQDATDAGVLIENLRDAAALNNLGMLKGPMSDKDIVFLKSVSSKLDPLQSNKQFEKNIVEMYNIAANKAGMPTITKLSEIPKERILPGQGGTKGEILAPGIDPMGKVPTKQGEFTNQDLLDTYNELLKDNTPQEVDQYFSEYFGIPITR